MCSGGLSISISIFIPRGRFVLHLHCGGFFSPVFYVPTYLRMDSAALVDL